MVAASSRENPLPLRRLLMSVSINASPHRYIYQTDRDDSMNGPLPVLHT